MTEGERKELAELEKGLRMALSGAVKLEYRKEEFGPRANQVTIKSFQFAYLKKLDSVVQQFASEYAQQMKDLRS